MKRLINKILTPVINLFNTIKEKIHESSFFINIKHRYEELDPQKKLIINWAVIGIVCLLPILFFTIGFSKVYSLKKNYENGKQIIMTLGETSETIKDLKSKLSKIQMGSSKFKNAKDLLQNLVGTSLIAKDSVNIGNETAGASTDSIKENFIDITLKHVSLKQVIRYCNNVENNKMGIRIKHLIIDTNSDPEGYMDATLKVAIYKIQ